jgi:hypothetical protein
MKTLFLSYFMVSASSYSVIESLQPMSDQQSGM